MLETCTQDLFKHQNLVQCRSWQVLKKSLVYHCLCSLLSYSVRLMQISSLWYITKCSKTPAHIHRHATLLKCSGSNMGYAEPLWNESAKPDCQRYAKDMRYNVLKCLFAFCIYNVGKAVVRKLSKWQKIYGLSKNWVWYLCKIQQK